MHRLKKILKWTLFLVASPIVLVYAINLFDVPLNPEIATYRPAMSEQVTDADNGYYYMVGMQAEPGRNPQQAGKQYVDALNAAKEAGKHANGVLAGKLESQALGKGKIEYKGKDHFFCRYKSEPCLPFFRKNRKAIRRMLRDNHVLVQRMEHLETYPHFTETMVASFEMPLAYTPLHNDLLLAKAALTADSGHVTQALNELQRSNRFWRMVLAESTTLIGKNWAQAIIYRDIRLATEIMARYPLSAKQFATVQSMLRPLEQKELSMSNAIKNEFQNSDSILRYVIRSAREKNEGFFDSERYLVNSLLEPLWQPNDMRNDSLKFYRRYEQIGRLTAPELSDYIKNKATAEIGDRYAYHWNYVYNPLGKFIASAAGPDYFLLGYIVRPHNLDARIRLIAVRFNILKNRIPRRRIPSYLEKIDASLKNPYTGETPHWDSKTSTLYFSVVSQNADKLEERQFLDRIEIEL